MFTEGLAAGTVSVKAGRDIRSWSLQMASRLPPQRGIPPEELVMGKIADFSSGSCVERRDSLSLGQWKDQRHLGCA